MKIFKNILIVVLLIFSLSGTVFANKNTTEVTQDPVNSFDSPNCTVSTEVWAAKGSDFLETMRNCSKGTSGVSIDNVGTGDNSIKWFSVRIGELASGFMRYAALFAVGAIVIAGVMYTTAYGDESKLGKAKKIVIFACLGLIIALASYSLVNAVIYIIYGAIG